MAGFFLTLHSRRQSSRTNVLVAVRIECLWLAFGRAFEVRGPDRRVTII